MILRSALVLLGGSDMSAVAAAAALWLRPCSLTLEGGPPIAAAARRGR